ncbi:MAG: 30S ribosomal protein S6 [Candidatus Eisenbacteria bacterium]|uniref:Small ribosomal subunit protein bS6 n=1 Tax=Eiseniibacteriota bacterium TaxID=2212470 RepID=A0A538SHI4_UNCEI|nr:MAG: 30S ribosomal protein S6 [Candidatus Eisenbacteria bacterium]
MKTYETTIIFDPGLEEARINEEVDRVSQSISQAGGEVVEVQRWGKRKLAYNIRKRRDGTYIHIKHKSPPELIGEMDRRFRLNEGVLRHLTVLAVKESPRAEEPGRAAEPAAAAAAGAAHATQSEEKV